AQAVHPDDRELVMRRHAQLLAEGGPRDIELRVVWPDGSVHMLFGRATVVRDELGQAIRVYGTNVDITERKQAEKALRESQLHLPLFTRQLLQAQEAERRSIARELHDEVGQELTGLGLLISTSQQLPPEQAQARLAQAQALVRELMEQVRTLALDLRPA